MLEQVFSFFGGAFDFFRGFLGPLGWVWDKFFSILMALTKGNIVAVIIIVGLLGYMVCDFIYHAGFEKSGITAMVLVKDAVIFVIVIAVVIYLGV